MARKVLGNDPFRRGAAEREDAPAPRPPPAPAKPAATASRPDTPELQVPRGRRAAAAPPSTPDPPGASARAAAPRGPLARHEPVAHPGSPKVKGEPTDPKGLPAPQPAPPRGAPPKARGGSPSVPFEAAAHGTAPSAMPLSSAPRPHPGSPSVPFEPTPHTAAPSAMPLGSAPRPHPGSPSVPFEPTPHTGTPSVAPRPHAGAPGVTFDATPHASAPTAVPLGSAPRPHPGSPSVPFEPTPHAGTPSVAPRAHEVATHGNPPGASELPAGGAAHAAADGAAPAGPPDETAGCAEQPTHHPAGALARPPASLSDALKGVWRAVRAASGLASRSTEVDAWGKDAELTRQLRPLAELLYEKYWRVQTDGIEHVPRGGCILVANHAGALPLDGPVLHLALERERPELADARWLLEDQVFHAPFVGLLANRLGAVRASPENALRLLSEGRPVIVFPEGFHGLSKRFGERYQLRRFGRGGYLKIAIRAGVPVVPVAIVGGEESMPLLGKVPGGFLGVEYLPLTLPPLPARWLIRFAPPIDFAGAPATPEDDLAWIERTNVAVRDQIERMLGELLAARPKVF